jgi:hypothetical protein
MGGSLTAHSDGLGCGASFILELPLQAPQRQEQSLAGHSAARETSPVKQPAA